MNKGDEFLQTLKFRLSHLPVNEVGKALSYYSESLQDKIEDGWTYEQAIRSFGTMEEIVANIEADIPMGSVVKDKVVNKTKSSQNNSALIILILLFTSFIWLPVAGFVLMVVIAIYAVLWTIPITICALYVSLFPMAIAGITSGIYRMFEIGFATGLAYFGFGLICTGLAIMLLKPLFECGKIWLKANIWPFKKIKQWLIRR